MLRRCFESDQVCEVCRFRYPVARLLFVSQNALNVVLVLVSLKVDCLRTFEVRRQKSEGFLILLLSLMLKCLNLLTLDFKCFFPIFRA